MAELLLVPFIDRSPETSPGKRRLFIVLGSMLILLLVALGTVALLTPGEQHIGG